MKRVVVSLLLAVALLCTACGKENESAVIGQTTKETGREETGREETAEEVGDSEMQEQNPTEADNYSTEQQEIVKNEADTADVTEDAMSNTTESTLSEEELLKELEELFGSLSLPTHKADYAESISAAIAALPAEKPESSLKQKDVDCDTLQWFNATYAMFVYGQGDDYHLIGGFNDEFNSRKDYLRDQLDKSWGITDRQTAIETLSWLATGGHAPEYAEMVQVMDMMGLLSCTDAELTEYFTQSAEEQQMSDEDRDSVIEYYMHIREVNSVCQDNGIDAWDYCRLMQISGNSYFAGYITLEECLSIQLAVSLAIQDQFDSWQELNDSYYYGYSYWAYGSYMVSFRKTAYDNLAAEEDCPWKVLDFNMPLEKFW